MYSLLIMTYSHGFWSLGSFLLDPASSFPPPLFPFMKAVTVQARDVLKFIWSIGSVLLIFFFWMFPEEWEIKQVTMHMVCFCVLLHFFQCLYLFFFFFLNFSILIWCVYQHLFISETALSQIYNRRMNLKRFLHCSTESMLREDVTAF